MFKAFFKWASGFAALVLLVVLLAVLNNNYSLRRMPRNEFRARMDRSIQTSTSWLSSRRDLFSETLH